MGAGEGGLKEKEMNECQGLGGEGSGPPPGRVTAQPGRANLPLSLSNTCSSIVSTAETVTAGECCGGGDGGEGRPWGELRGGDVDSACTERQRVASPPNERVEWCWVLRVEWKCQTASTPPPKWSFPAHEIPRIRPLTSALRNAK